MPKKSKYQASLQKPASGANAHPPAGVIAKLFAAVTQAAPNAPLPDRAWDDAAVLALTEHLPEDGRAGFMSFVNELSALAQTLKSQADVVREETAQAQRSKEDWLARAAELEPQQAKLAAQAAAQDERQSRVDQESAQLLAMQAQAITRERELIVRESQLRSGLLDEQQASLAALREKIASLEAQRDALPLAIEQDRERLISQARESAARLQARADDLLEEAQQRAQATIEREVNVQRRERLSGETETLLNARRESMRVEFREEVQEEIKAKTELIERLERKRRDAGEKADSLQQELDELQEFRERVGDNPQGLLDQLEALKSANRALDRKNQELLQSRDEDDSSLLREQRERLQERLDVATEDLYQLRRKESEWRRGVAEQEDWQRERTVLQRHRDLLAAAVDQLKEEVDGLLNKQQGATVFPALTRMDIELTQPAATDRPPELKVLVEDLQRRIAYAEPDKELHFKTEDLQLFVGGLAMSQLHIFQGISGTGKTSLATAFAKAVGGECTNIAVQAGWRDKADLLGHYNAFEKRFYEPNTLQAIYRAQTEADKNRIHVVLLDEMNLSRPEQYFAEFLSTMEYSEADRWINLMEARPSYGVPEKFRNGRDVRLPMNLWFIGTANHDETTTAFADKTHDRAFVLDLPRHEPTGLSLQRPQARAAWGFRELRAMFDEACKDHHAQVRELISSLDASELTRTLREDFDLGSGNRLERQMLRFVPVVKAVGGSTALALDHLLSSRIFREGKVTGRHDVRQGSVRKVALGLEKLWTEGKLEGEPTRSLQLLEKDIKRLERGG